MQVKQFVKDFKKENYDFFVLAGDIGGTSTRLAVAGIRNGIKLILMLEFESKKIKKFYEAVNETLKFAYDTHGIEISRACFSPAGVLNHDKTSCRLTNLPLIINVKEILGNSLLSSVKLINDFEAVGYGMRFLGKESLFRPSKAEHGEGVKVIVGPGTGLGKSIIADKVLASEGGHATFPPINELELELANYIKKKTKAKEAIGYEELVSGPGIANIYSFLRYIKEYPETKYTKEIDKAKSKPELISKYAGADKTCASAMKLFVRFCARCASNFALDALAYGGVYITGGIAPKNADLFKQYFMDEFIKNSRMSSVLKRIPVFIVMNYDASLYGAASIAANI